MASVVPGSRALSPILCPLCARTRACSLVTCARWLTSARVCAVQMCAHLCVLDEAMRHGSSVPPECALLP